jgi:hypothetical protein
MAEIRSINRSKLLTVVTSDLQVAALHAPLPPTFAANQVGKSDPVLPVNQASTLRASVKVTEFAAVSTASLGGATETGPTARPGTGEVFAVVRYWACSMRSDRPPAASGEKPSAFWSA